MLRAFFAKAQQPFPSDLRDAEAEWNRFCAANFDPAHPDAFYALQFAPRFERVVLSDAANTVHDFVTFKLQQRGLTQCSHVPPDASAEVVLCIDVLEHLTNPSSVFTTCLDTTVEAGWAAVRADDRVAPISRLIELKPGCLSAVPQTLINAAAASPPRTAAPTRPSRPAPPARAGA